MHFQPLLNYLFLFHFLGSTNEKLILAQKEMQVMTFLQPPMNPYHQIKDIPLPAGYKRIITDSFGGFLRQLTLKKDRSVFLYNGRLKNNQAAQFAVLDISIGTTDLQQCADAVMRLRAEYLYQAKKYEQIIFKDYNGKSYRFMAPYSKENFTKYLLRVFGMCGTASLEKQMKSVNNFKTIQPGDVLIRGGFPGHAVLVIDVAENVLHEKIYLLAQSYMPAQDIHVLLNPLNAELSPWYKVNEWQLISTPEYLFYTTQLKRW